jgi:recombination protein RecT
MNEIEKVHPITALENQLTRRSDELRRALPGHIDSAHFIRVVMTAVQRNPDLMACDRTSLWNECLLCAQDGLLPDSREGALIPFKSKVTYIPMVYGLLKKFRNSGQFKWVDTDIVYHGEEFYHYKDETGPHFKHTPGDDRDPKNIRRIYAVATTQSNGFFIEDMTLDQVQKRRNMSRAGREDAPWSRWPEEMMKKTALRSLSKLLPMSSDIDALMQRDEDAVLGVESVEQTRAELAERPSTQAMLDKFGGEPGTTADVSNKTGTANESGSAELPLDGPEENFDHQQSKSVDPVAAARQAGRESRAAGLQRRAVPGELRGQQQLATAWQEGWDEGGEQATDKA